jgi:hypothetical protein
MPPYSTPESVSRSPRRRVLQTQCGCAVGAQAPHETWKRRPRVPDQAAHAAAERGDLPTHSVAEREGLQRKESRHQEAVDVAARI